MFATYKYCLAQSTPSNLILTTKRELNSDGVRAFLCQCWMGRDVKLLCSNRPHFFDCFIITD